jgi:hypothetical protein
MRTTFLALTLAASAGLASAQVVWNQGFETDAAGWLDNDDLAGYGSIDRVASGTGGIASKSGGFHAVATDASIGSNASVGGFSRFDGYRSVWEGGYVASIDVYLDTSWADGSGFDYSVAANGSDNAHQRDFVFHVTKSASGAILVGGSNNTNFLARQDLATINHYAVSTSGWYTLEHVLRDAGDGTLAVDLNLRDAGGSLLFTETRNDISDVIATQVGGNRYAWFTAVDIAGGVAFDNHTLTVVPAPGAMALLGLGGLAAARRRRA